MTPWLSIVGVGEDGLGGLGPEARTRIDEAEVLVGAERHLALVEDGPAERFSWASPLSATVERLAGLRGRRVCVLATGDPMAYGIGVTLVRRFGADAVRVLPGLSAFCLARARLGWPLAETVELTLHGRPIELVLAHLVPGGRLLLLSEDGTTPARVAELLVGAGYGPSRLHVLWPHGRIAGAPDRDHRGRGPGGARGRPQTRSRSSSKPGPARRRRGGDCPTTPFVTTGRSRSARCAP